MHVYTTSYHSIRQVQVYNVKRARLSEAEEEEKGKKEKIKLLSIRSEI